MEPDGELTVSGVTSTANGRRQFLTYPHGIETLPKLSIA